MNRHEEAVFEAKAEKMFAGQRELPLGRDFRWNKHEGYEPNSDAYEEKWNNTFPGAPGSPEWWEKRFGA